MRQILPLMALLLWATPLLAETYTWVDGQGTVNFTDDYSQIPRKYRKKARRLGIEVEQAAPAPGEPTAPAAGQARQPQAGTGGSAAPANDDKETYAGRPAGAWQQEFKTQGAEVKRLERQLVDLEALIKNPVGVSQERIFGLPREFKDTQVQYNEALKRYNELNDAANKAGLPGEFRK